MKNNDIKIIILVTFLGAIVLAGLSGSGMMGLGYYGMMRGFFFSWIVCLLVIVALVLFIVWLIQQITQNERRRP